MANKKLPVYRKIRDCTVNACLCNSHAKITNGNEIETFRLFSEFDSSANEEEKYNYKSLRLLADAACYRGLVLVLLSII